MSNVPAASRLRHFPVSWFATVMGLAGFAIAWQRAEVLFPVPALLRLTLLAFAGAVFVLLLVVYATKAVRHPTETAAEWRHPVRVNFVPTLSIGLILLGTAAYPVHAGLSDVLWSIGAALNLLLTLYVMSFWMNHTGFQIQHMNPAWFIPVVGNVLVPLVGIFHASSEIAWFFFSIGLVFWIVLLTIVFYRVIFHEPLPERLVPTLFILIAPPAVGFLAYDRLVGIDAVARVLYYSALFFTLLLLTQITRFARLKFYLSWWAYSFPLAAVTVATLRMYAHTGNDMFRTIAFALLGLLTAVIAFLVVRTLIGVARKEICVEE